MQSSVPASQQTRGRRRRTPRRDRRAARGRRRTACGGSTAVPGRTVADSTSTKRPARSTSTNASRHPSSNTASRNGRLSSSSLAMTTPSNGPRREIGPRFDAVGMPFPLRRRTPRRRRTASRRAQAGRAASTERASVPGPAPASTTVNGSGRPIRSHSASRYRAIDGAEQRADLRRRDEVAAPSRRPPSARM